MTRSTQIFIFSGDRKRGKTKPSDKKEERVKVDGGNLARLIGVFESRSCDIGFVCCSLPSFIPRPDNDRRKRKPFRL